jgi:hypothetical protein
MSGKLIILQCLYSSYEEVAAVSIACPNYIRKARATSANGVALFLTH